MDRVDSCPKFEENQVPRSSRGSGVSNIYLRKDWYYIIDNDYFNIKYDENKIKTDIKNVLIENNKLLTDKQLNELLLFIDNENISIDNEYTFIKQYKDDKFALCGEILIYYIGTKQKLSYNLIKKINKAYHVSLNPSGDKIYKINFNQLFCIISDAVYFHQFKKDISCDEIIEYVKTSLGKTYYTKIFELSENDDYIRKSICLSDKIVYKIDFGPYGIYIGQTKDLKKRLQTHKSTAKNRRHCYVLNELYNNDEDFFNKSITNNVEIIEKPVYIDYSNGYYSITDFEYDLQIEALRNGERLLGKQCWDKDFKEYLSKHVNIDECQLLLSRSYEINRDPNIDGGIHTNTKNKSKSYEIINNKSGNNYFIKAYKDPVEKLGKELSNRDFAWFMRLIPYIRIYDCVLYDTDNNNYLSIKDLSSIMNVDYSNLKSVIKSFEENELIKKIKRPSNKDIYKTVNALAINPFILMNGEYIDKDVKELFSNTKWNSK